MVSGLGYYSISMSNDIYSFDPYIYCTLSGVVEIPGATLTIPFVNVLGRRLSNIICMSSTGIFILAIAFIPKSMGWLMMLLALIGKMTIAAAFQIIYLHVSEVFPTEVRTRGAGLGDMMAKVGSMTAPFIIDSLHAVWEPAPAVVVGCSGFLACIAIYLLPETKGAALHDTVESLEAGSPNVSVTVPYQTFYHQFYIRIMDFYMDFDFPQDRWWFYQNIQNANGILEEHQRRRRIRRVVSDRMNPFVAMEDQEFIARFRLRKDTMHDLIQEMNFW
ncbi:hypothetical protein Pcinc_016000 [Petrolisthes cinctipes]|uniref:Major facilitator superfamily (MFS) profile domain-containing protein n=1 Tax=Petrolisthes cinctipes TaxID=88211 RepID=A0AAE1FTL5_PETCI|nr:hypothetical protein Pcinc_016000 [Petrolisthes cinctipes]